jgi:hypothetical protein
MSQFKIGDKVRWDTNFGPCPHGGETFTVEYVYPQEKDPLWRSGVPKQLGEVPEVGPDGKTLDAVGDDMRVMLKLVVDRRPDVPSFRHSPKPDAKPVDEHGLRNDEGLCMICSAQEKESCKEVLTETVYHGGGARITTRLRADRLVLAQ